MRNRMNFYECSKKDTHNYINRYKKYLDKIMKRK